MKRRDPPSEENFEKLLAWLDSDREKAGEKYHRIHFRLIRIFAAKGSIDAEDLADQTFNVVALKIDWLIENYEGDPALYFYGVARKIFQEDNKRGRIPIPPAPPDNTEIEQRCACLDRCLEKKASTDERDWVLRYQDGRGQERINNRKLLAEELGISLNALRIRIFHIQARLRPCIEDCLRELDY
jgi:DNA-directed RNA polymerase specialized sigma24 family protein